MQAYAFPLFNLILIDLDKILKFIGKSSADCSSLATQELVPDTSLHGFVFPMELPLVRDLLCQLGNRSYHQGLEGLSLNVWPLSGNLSEIGNFLHKLPIWQANREESLPDWFTTPDGRFSVIGVSQNRLILSSQL